MKIILKNFNYNGVSHSLRFIPDLSNWYSFLVPAGDVVQCLNLSAEGDLLCDNSYRISMSMANDQRIFANSTMLTELGLYQSAVRCESEVAECFYSWLWSGTIKSIRNQLSLFESDHN